MKGTFDLNALLISDYDKSLSHSGVSGERVAQRLHAIAQIGLTEHNGSSRIGFSPEERAAKELVKKWMLEAGLAVKEDGAGNVFGRLEGKDASAPAILSGSHLDSVPEGGHFDGPLGVVAALEVAQAWRDTGYQPETPYEVVVFTDEEGSRFNGGLTGSQALVGDLDIEKQREMTDIYGQSFEEVMLQAGLSINILLQAARSTSELKAFVEVHIEQGKRLEKEQLPVGIVTGIAGPSWINASFKGQAGHAGNTPMNDRQDALVAAGDFIVGVRALPSRVSSTAVATVGKLHVYPNGVNVIPGEVQLTVDVRDIFGETRDKLVEQIIQLGKTISHTHGVAFSYEETLRVDPVPVRQRMQDMLAKAVLTYSSRHIKGQQEEIRPYFLISGAGHDAMIVGRHVPMAMLFVRSKGGISHNPQEWTSLNDCTVSVHVLKTYVEELMKHSDLS